MLNVSEVRSFFMFYIPTMFDSITTLFLPISVFVVIVYAFRRRDVSSGLLTYSVFG